MKKSSKLAYGIGSILIMAGGLLMVMKFNTISIITLIVGIPVLAYGIISGGKK